jgi:hypothetical protein
LKNWLPSGKSIAVWVGAVALAVWSLPQVPNFPNSYGYSSRYMTNDHTGAIPTVTLPTPDTQATSSKPPTGSNAIQAPPSAAQDQTPPTQPAPAATQPTLPSLPTDSPYSPYVPWPTAKLRLRVIDGRSQQPLPGAEVVIIETEQRLITDKDGYTPWTDAPIIRNPRYRPLVAELHGQLGVIAYKNGYRDSVHLGIRMHDGTESESTVWMYKLGPGDIRIEPLLYQVPYHHLWLVELADRFRSKTQLGEGPEKP